MEPISIALQMMLLLDLSKEVCFTLVDEQLELGLLSWSTSVGRLGALMSQYQTRQFRNDVGILALEVYFPKLMV